MKTQSIIFYLLPITLCLLAYSTVTYESTLSAFLGCVVFTVLIQAAGKNISAWLDKEEQRKENEPL